MQDPSERLQPMMVHPIGVLRTPHQDPRYGPSKPKRNARRNKTRPAHTAGRAPSDGCHGDPSDRQAQTVGDT